MNYSDYTNIINLRRIDSEKKAAEKLQDFYKAHPAIRDLENQIKIKCLEFAGTIIEADSTAADALKPLHDKEIERLQKKRSEMLKKLSVTDADFAPQYHCKSCSDTGFIEGEMCSCLKSLVVRERYQNYALLERLKDENFAKFDLKIFSDDESGQVHLGGGAVKLTVRDTVKENLSLAKRFVKSFPNNRSLLFTGGTGSGKTFMANCIAKELMDQNHMVLYYTAVSLAHMLKDNLSFTKSTDVTKKYYDILNADLLIIDDLLDVPNFILNEMFEVIDHRMSGKKSTIVTTNIAIDAMEDVFGERFFSRLSTYVIMKFYGRDNRII